jgi:hypothetical protein
LSACVNSKTSCFRSWISFSFSYNSLRASLAYKNITNYRIGMFHDCFSKWINITDLNICNMLEWWYYVEEWNIKLFIRRKGTSNPFQLYVNAV